MGDWPAADVLIGGDTIVGVGPGLRTAADDDGMIVIDCAGTVVLPAALDHTGAGPVGTLTPGERADVAVYRVADAAPSRHHLDLLVLGGQVQLWDGHPTAAAPSPATAPEPPHDQDHPYVGSWCTEDRFLRQELLPDGRYDEARGDRESAYTGRYWINGDRIDYLDDLGFWAYGEFVDGTLHHAGYHMTRD
ncbi:Atu4866 domain-containing protein [Streptomyces profundus]|nr:Atu4866 domain-containing protein [Streptomyces sp. MA3_2.13]